MNEQAMAAWMPSLVTMSGLITLIGWLGAGSLLLAYGLVSSRRLAGDSVTFHVLNSAGALLLGVNTAYHGAWPSAVLNLVWIGIGLAALGRARTRAPARGLRGDSVETELVALDVLHHEARLVDAVGTQKSHAHGAERG